MNGVVRIEGIRHTALSAAGVAFHDDVGRIAGGTELAQAQCRRSARDISLMHEIEPRKIGQMAFSAGQEESN